MIELSAFWRLTDEEVSSRLIACPRCAATVTVDHLEDTPVLFCDCGFIVSAALVENMPARWAVVATIEGAIEEAREEALELVDSPDDVLARLAEETLDVLDAGAQDPLALRRLRVDFEAAGAGDAQVTAALDVLIRRVDEGGSVIEPEGP